MHVRGSPHLWEPTEKNKLSQHTTQRILCVCDRMPQQSWMNPDGHVRWIALKEVFGFLYIVAHFEDYLPLQTGVVPLPCFVGRRRQTDSVDR